MMDESIIIVDLYDGWAVEKGISLAISESLFFYQSKSESNRGL